MSIDLLAPATEQINWLTTGQISSAELLEAYIARAEKFNPAINAIVAQNLEQARQTAREMDSRRANGETLGPLNGLPMTIKDSYDVDGLPAVCGVPKLANRPPETEDAYVVKRLKAAGAILWGKTNTPLYAGDIQTFNKVYGVSNNPYDLDRTPGGSSGGAAAALASGLTPLEVGSDIGGSLRTPAHFCGVCALKPTHGLISLKGHVPPDPGLDVPEPDLAVAGPMARNMRDLELLMSIIAPEMAHVSVSSALADCNVAIWHEENFPIGAEVDQAITIVKQVLLEQGGSVKDQ